MTDKELLELAAKAAGIELAWMTGIGPMDFETGINWNPLTDDGDALRLLIKLKNSIEIYSFRGSVIAKYWTRSSTGYKWLEEDDEPCPYAATRRAIVRAAAEIGREL